MSIPREEPLHSMAKALGRRRWSLSRYVKLRKDGQGPSSLLTVTGQAGEMVEESPMEVVDDATLEQMLYGGQTATLQGKEGLTAAQEERLYSEGTIRPAAEAETLRATREVDEAEATWAVSEMEGRSSVGHKFGLPKKPYPEGFQLKERYHPVLGQITRLMMRHGKLGVAQRVCVKRRVGSAEEGLECDG